MNETYKLKLDNVTHKIVNTYNDVDCKNCNRSICGGCLNLIRQSLEYLALFTCDYYQIPLTKISKNGNVVINDNPTLGDMAPLIEKYFKQNNLLWNKEVDTHIGSLWILGNLGSHAHQEMITQSNEINRFTIENALNSMYIVTSWFYNHFGVECPIQSKGKILDINIELKNKSKELLLKLENLKQKSSEIEADIKNNEMGRFDEIYFEDLIESIEAGLCVLFIGPDMAVDNEGNSVHENFYKSISRNNIEYNGQDSFFMPKAEKQIELKALNFYSKTFPEQNSIGQTILEKLAQIPFSLIISITPDDTINRIYKKYNKKCNFIYYNQRTKLDVNEPSKEDPIIFNMLGCPAIDGKFIFTHKQFYEYINQKQEVKIPFEIENKIMNVTHYIFIGIDYDKWYNRLLLFNLNLYNDAEAYTFNSKKINDINQNFINRQFNITFINDEDNEFIDTFLLKCKKATIHKSLIETFVENTTNDILTISESSQDGMEKLKYIEIKIDELLI